MHGFTEAFSGGDSFALGFANKGIREGSLTGARGAKEKDGVLHEAFGNEEERCIGGKAVESDGDRKEKAQLNELGFSGSARADLASACGQLPFTQKAVVVAIEKV